MNHDPPTPTSRPTVSVAMTTYNGAAHVLEQLESLAHQTIPPDELVISDDASTDATLQIVRAFADRAPFKVVIEAGKENIGFARNFERAVASTTGDLVFTADHDDVWLPHKIERAAALFRERPAVGLVISDATIVDEGLSPKGYRTWDRVGFDGRYRRVFAAGRGFEVLLRHSFVAMPTMAFRASFKPLAVPVGEGWFPDAWAALTVAAASETALVDEPTYLYRQHGNQMQGVKRKGPWRKYIEAKRRVDPAMYEQLGRRHATARDRIASYTGPWPSPLTKAEVLDRFSDKIRFCATRASLRRGVLRRWPLVALGLARGDYHRLAHGWKTVALDLVI